MGYTEISWDNKTAAILAAIICPILSMAIIIKKRLTKKLWSYILFITSVLGGALGGWFVGLLFVWVLYYTPAEKSDF